LADETADVALVGLAVMGQNLVLNMTDHGYRVAVHNRTRSVTEAFVAGPGGAAGVLARHDLPSLVASLARPRRVLVMVQAGGAVDAVLEALEPLLEPGDIVADLGNSHYADTARRAEKLAARGLHFAGTGVSGGEEGARHGPSIMPGGDQAAWPALRELFQAIAARVDGAPCCDWIGAGGSGHFVKTIHNGIEYGDMQLICEAYDMLLALGLDYPSLHETFAEWSRAELDSYLVEITANILARIDTDGTPLVEKILDVAGQKGTGRWTGITALELGSPVTVIAEAVFARCLSARKDARVRAAPLLAGPPRRLTGAEVSAHDIRQALYASKIASYAQGFMLLREASAEHGWGVDLGRLALLWRGGCIIRSRFLDDIARAFAREPALECLFLDPFFCAALGGAQQGWRRTVAAAAVAGVPLPAMSAALTFYDGYRSERLPANLLQAQRDYFGAHTYERTDRPRGQRFHTDWIGSGGVVRSGAYDA
jgi:6-phosphogluconate dehydrogenase